MTCRVIDSSLRWQAWLVTTMSEVCRTTSPTSVAHALREEAGGICQQEGGGGARLVPNGQHM